MIHISDNHVSSFWIIGLLYRESSENETNRFPSNFKYDGKIDSEICSSSISNETIGNNQQEFPLKFVVITKLICYTNPQMHQSHIPQCTILYDAVWDWWDGCIALKVERAIALLQGSFRL